MAICPFAVQQIIPESYTQGWINPTTLIFHEAVSSADSLYGFWTTPGVELESHFYIGSTGTIYQFMDTNIRADANVQANGFAVSVETWDDSNRDPLLAWNPAMVAAAKRLSAWVCDTHGIRKGPATTWNGGGIGGHNWFPIPWADGPRQCPGQTRNAQLRNDIIPAVANGYDWRNQEDDMPMTAADANTLWMAKLRNASNVDGQEETAYAVEWVTETADKAARIERKQIVQDAKLDAILQSVTDGEGVDEDRLNATVAKATAEATERAVTFSVLPALRSVLEDLLGEDNEDQAKAIVAAMGARLSGGN